MLDPPFFCWSDIDVTRHQHCSDAREETDNGNARISRHLQLRRDGQDVPLLKVMCVGVQCLHCFTLTPLDINIALSPRKDENRGATSQSTLEEAENGNVKTGSLGGTRMQRFRSPVKSEHEQRVNCNTSIFRVTRHGYSLLRELRHLHFV